MNYTLITKTGKIMQFYILATAQAYQQAYGGVVTMPQIIQSGSIDKPEVSCYNVCTVND